jgi:adenosylmethionine-8-amino-7-oxononanoate aminotransferase
MAITTFTNEIFDAFYEDINKALFHGHTFTAILRVALPLWLV